MSMSAIKALRDDHKKVTGLFRQYEAFRERAALEMRRGVALQICMELEIHSRIEEEIFYPEFGAVADDTGRALVENSLTAHDSVKEKIKQLKAGLTGSSAFSQGFDAEFSGLMSEVEEHVTEEETQMFPLAEKVLAEKQTEIAGRMAKLKGRLLSEPQYASAQPEFTQNPNGDEQTRAKESAKGELERGAA